MTQEQSVKNPKELAHLFAERASAGDLDGMLALYEDGAAFLGPDGAHALGVGAIRERLENLLAASPHITPAGSPELVMAEDVALLCTRWQMTVGAGDGAAVVEGSSIEVTRRQADGSWLYVIDHPRVAPKTRRDLASDPWIEDTPGKAIG